MPCKVEEISVELCSKGDSIPALSIHSTTLNIRDSIPASLNNLGVMAIKTDSEKMVAPSNNENKFIYPQKKFKFGPVIGISVKVSHILKDSSVYFDDIPTFAFKNYWVNIAPLIYLKICKLISSGKPLLASKGGG